MEHFNCKSLTIRAAENKKWYYISWIINITSKFTTAALQFTRLTISDKHWYAKFIKWTDFLK